MIILGINAYHADSSACLVKNGKLLSAVEEERFTRIKHWSGLPKHSILYCLEDAQITLDKVDYICINSNPRSNLVNKLLYTIVHKPDINLILQRLKNRLKRNSIVDEIQSFLPLNKFSGSLVNVDHHLAHLSSAFHVSPFDKASIISVDGFGDFASSAWGVGDGIDIEVKGSVLFPHSLGIFYQTLTQFLGFPNYGDEYKVMGLAPYGKPKFLKEMKSIVNIHDSEIFKLNLEYFIFHKKSFKYNWDNGSPAVGSMFSNKLIDLLGPVRNKDEKITQKHFDIAHSVQLMYEEAFFKMLNEIHKHDKIDNLCVAGGCGNNSVANGKITTQTNFKNVYVQSASGDAGGAIGSAFSTYFKKNKNVKRHFVMNNSYLGKSFSNNKIEKTLLENNALLDHKIFSYRKENQETALVQFIANQLTQGKVIGWFQGKMEFGPRALGNRSIIADPRRADMKSILNKKIKKRESFRPFAPSILREKVSDWFEKDDDVPFMMKVFKIKVEKRKLIPAVAHVDGTGRLQTVTKIANKRYYKLIKAFEKLTNVPIILNTSFNENEPVVQTPQEALNCFLRTKMDILVLEDWIVLRI